MEKQNHYNPQEILKDESAIKEKLGKLFIARTNIEDEIKIYQAAILRKMGQDEKADKVTELWEKIDQAKKDLMNDFFNGKQKQFNRSQMPKGDFKNNILTKKGK